MRKYKYGPLGRYFDGLETGKVSVRLSFSQVEGILRAPVPAFAFLRLAWWAIDWRQSHAVAWLPAGGEGNTGARRTARATSSAPGDTRDSAESRS